MNISLQEGTYGPYPPSGTSSRTSIANGTQQNRYSQATSIQSNQGSTSNFSVHTATATFYKDLPDLSGQGPLPPVSHHSSDPSRGRSHDRKSFHSLSKPTFGFRNQSLSTVCTIREPEFDRSSFGTSTPSPSSLEDEDDSESSPSPVYAPATEVHTVTRARALRSFEPTETDELAFEKGDIIHVVNRDHKDWWQGHLKSRTGNSPVNYVEPLPEHRAEPTLAELAAEAQQEAALFSQAANFDRLLTMLQTLDPAKDNIADNEEIQLLYRSCIALRPKIVKLIDEYSQRLSDLVSMNESFVRARTIFDHMMEGSLTRYDNEQQRPTFSQPQSTYPRINVGRSTSSALGQLKMQPQPRVQRPYQQQQQAPQPQFQTAYVEPYPAQDDSGALYYPQAQPQLADAPPQREQSQTRVQNQNQQQPRVQLEAHPQSQHTLQQPPVQSQVYIQMQPQKAVQKQHQAQAQTLHSPVETKVVASHSISKAVPPIPFPVSARSAATEERLSPASNADLLFQIASKRNRTTSTDAYIEPRGGGTRFLGVYSRDK